MSLFDWIERIWVLYLVLVIVYFAIDEFREWKKMLRKMVLILAIVLVWAGTALAAGPYLVCNPITYTPPAGDTLTYNVTGLPASIVATNIPPSSNTSYGFELSLSGIAAGSYTVTAQTCVNDSIWGQACSAQSAPFSFTVPGGPPAASTLKISTTQ